MSTENFIPVDQYGHPKKCTPKQLKLIIGYENRISYEKTN